MSNRTRERLTKNLAALEKRYELLQAQQDAANRQFQSELSASQRVPLEQGIKDRDDDLQQVECQLDAVEAELAKLDARLGDPNRDHLDFEGRIHKIDYTEVREAIAKLIERARQDCAASLLLLQESNTYGGKWCLDAIRDELRRSSFHDIKPRNIAFRSDERKDRLALLDRIAGHFNAHDPKEEAKDPDTRAREIGRKIAAATHIGSTELIVIDGWDYLQSQAGLLEWFLREFWTPLLRDFRAHDKRKNAKLIVVLVADIESPEELLRDHCCDDENFSEEKLLPLRLRNWHRHEIETFLSSGAVAWAGAETIPDLTDIIHRASVGGIPRLAYEALRKHVFNEV